MSEINDLEIEDGVSLIAKAYEKQAEEKAFQMYLQKYAWMDEKTFIPFEEFYKPDNLATDNRSVEEILEEVREVLNTHKGGWAL